MMRMHVDWILLLVISGAVSGASGLLVLFLLWYGNRKS